MHRCPYTHSREPLIGVHEIGEPQLKARGPHGPAALRVVTFCQYFGSVAWASGTVDETGARRMQMPNRDLVRQQFGANAKHYATSPVHAKGASLYKLVDLLPLQPAARALDIASAAGHVALALAPHVSSVVCSDLTPEMLKVAEFRAKESGITNLATRLADAEDLPFDDASFDLATCRIAAHHFGKPEAFVSEMVRVVKPGGYLGFVDNVVPSDPEVAAFTNQWEAKRDPSHVRCLSADEWRALFAAEKIEIMHVELMPKEMDFSLWADNMALSAETRSQLWAELHAASMSV